MGTKTQVQKQSDDLFASREQAKWLSEKLEEARLQIDRERQDHIETLMKASAFIVEQDRALGRLRAAVNAMSDDVGSQVIRTREHLARFVAAGVRGDFRRPMSHRPQPEMGDEDDRPDATPAPAQEERKR